MRLVKDHLEYKHLELPEHVDALSDICQGNVPGCGDDNASVERNELGEGERNVASPSKQALEEGADVEENQSMSNRGR